MNSQEYKPNITVKVDRIAHKRDSESCFLKFTPRNPKSKWGRRNQQRAQKMIDAGLMTKFGQTLIVIAKNTEKWETEE